MLSTISIAAQYLVLLGLCGIGPYLWLCPAKLKGKFGWILLPSYGLGMIVWIGTLCIANDQSLERAVRIMIGSSLGMAAVYGIARFRKPSAIQASSRPELSLISIFAVIAGFVLLAAPLTVRPHTRLPMRMGIDAALYLDAAQTLAQNATLQSPMPVLAFAGLKVHHRWGAPINLAAASLFTGTSNVYRTGFTTMLVLCLLIALLTGLIAHAICLSDGRSSILIAFLLLLNINLLNTVYEAQWAQIQGMVFLLLFVLFLGLLRSSAVLSVGERIKAFASLAIFWAGLFCSYSESLFLMAALLGLLGGIELIQICMKRESALIIDMAKSYACVIGAIVTGFVLIYPYTKTVLMHLVHLDVAPVGYWVPRWAMPSEILGLINLYRHFDLWSPGYTSALRLHRSHLDRFVNTGLSIALVAALVWSVRRSTNWSRVMGLAVVGLVVFMYYYCMHKGMINYVFMKTYVFLLPLGHAFFWAHLFKSTPSRTIRRASLGFAAGLVVLMTASCYSYIREFNQTAEPITDGFISLSDSISSHPSLSQQFVFLPRQRGSFNPQRRFVDRNLDFLMLPLLRNSLLIDQETQAGVISGDLNAYLDRRVCLILRKQEFPNRSDFGHGSYPIVWQNNYWIFIDSQRTLRQIARPGIGFDFADIWSIEKSSAPSS